MSVPPPAGEPSYNININSSEDGKRLVADVSDIVINGKHCHFKVSCKVPDGKSRVDVEPKLRALVATKVKEILAYSQSSNLDMTGHEIKIKKSQGTISITIDGQNFPVETEEKPPEPEQKLPETLSSSSHPAAGDESVRPDDGRAIVPRFIRGTRRALKGEISVQPDTNLRKAFIGQMDLLQLYEEIHKCSKDEIPKIRYKRNLTEGQKSLISNGQGTIQETEFRCGPMYHVVETEKEKKDQELSDLVGLILNKLAAERNDTSTVELILDDIRSHPILFKVVGQSSELRQSFIKIYVQLIRNNPERGTLVQRAVGFGARVRELVTTSKLSTVEESYIANLSLKEMAEAMDEVAADPDSVPKIKPKRGSSPAEGLKLRPGKLGVRNKSENKEELSALMHVIFVKLQTELNSIQIPKIYPEKYEMDTSQLGVVQGILFNIMSSPKLNHYVQKNKELREEFSSVLQLYAVKQGELDQVTKPFMSVTQVIDYLINPALPEFPEFRKNILIGYRWGMRDTKELFREFCLEKREEPLFQRLFQEFCNRNKNLKLDGNGLFKEFTKDLFGQYLKRDECEDTELQNIFNEFLKDYDAVDVESQLFFRELLYKYQAAENVINALFRADCEARQIAITDQNRKELLNQFIAANEAAKEQQQLKNKIQKLCREWLNDPFVTGPIDLKKQPHLLEIFQQMEVSLVARGELEIGEEVSSSSSETFGSKLQEVLEDPLKTDGEAYKQLVKDFSQDLTTIADRLYSQINTTDFVGLAWTEDTNPEKAQNIKKMPQFSNELSHYLSWTILQEKDTQKRALIMAFLLDVEVDLIKEKKQLFLAYAVRSSLSAAPVNRLNQTKKILQKQSWEIYKKHHGLLVGMDNHKLHRDFCENYPATRPYLGVLQTDVLFLRDPNKVASKGFLNGYFIDKYSEVMERVRGPQTGLKPTPLKYRGLMKELVDGSNQWRGLGEEKLFTLSKKLEEQTTRAEDDPSTCSNLKELKEIKGCATDISEF